MTPAIHIREPGLRDAEALGRVQGLTWRATYRGLVPEETLRAFSPEARAEKWKTILSGGGLEGGIHHLAEVDGEVAGFASGGPARGNDPNQRWEVYGLYVLPEYQRRGVGRALMSRQASAFAAIEPGPLVVWVLSNNPWRAFYDALGGDPFEQQTAEIGGALLEQTGYVWSDVRNLLPS